MPHAAIYNELNLARKNGVPDHVARKQLTYGLARHTGYIPRTCVKDSMGQEVKPFKDWHRATRDGKGVVATFVLESGEKYHVIEHWPPGNVESYDVEVDKEGIHRA